VAPAPLAGVEPRFITRTPPRRRVLVTNPGSTPASGAGAHARSVVPDLPLAKTFRNLWPHVVSWDNLVRAYRKCRRRKRHKPDAARFGFAWEANLLELQRRLRDGSYEPGPYRHFFIHDPKKRKISAAPFVDRIVHHAVVNVLEPIYERQFLFDSYACRRAKGTHRALDRAERYLRRYPYSLKTDVVKVFPNVDHALLLGILSQRIADAGLLELLRRIIASGEAAFDKGPAGRAVGLPIGNLTSQFFANVFLDRVDHFVKEELRIPGYVRYCDDLVVFGESKEQLRAALAALSRQFAGLGLRLHDDKTQLRPCHCGLKFLGFVLGSGRRRVQQTALRRLNRRLRRWRWLRKHGCLPGACVGRSMAVWRNWLGQANAVGVWRALRRRWVHGRRRTRPVTSSQAGSPDPVQGATPGTPPARGSGQSRDRPAAARGPATPPPWPCGAGRSPGRPGCV
jgi:RNA-directed DNA polymerase